MLRRVVAFSTDITSAGIANYRYQIDRKQTPLAALQDILHHGERSCSCIDRSTTSPPVCAPGDLLLKRRKRYKPEQIVRKLRDADTIFMRVKIWPLWFTCQPTRHSNTGSRRQPWNPRDVTRDIRNCGLFRINGSAAGSRK